MGNSKSARATWDIYVDKWNFADAYQPLPTHKFQTLKATDSRACIIFYNGTFAPVHYGHIDALCSAKTYLESNGFHVIAGYISPCWNGYCASKMKRNKSQYISHYHRLNMINLSIHHLNWVMLDTNECFANKFYYPIQTISQFYERILKYSKLKKGQFDIVWLTGVDLGVPAIPQTYASFLRTICIDNRLHDSAKDRQFSMQIKQRVEMKNKQYDGPLMQQMYCKCDPLQLSSTKIRQLSENGQMHELIAMFKTHNMESVAHYIIQHHIYSNHTKMEAKDDSENQTLVDFKQYVAEHGFFGANTLQDILTPAVLTEYLRKGKYLADNEAIVSFKESRAGKNGFRGTSYRLYDFEIDDLETKQDTNETKDWKLFLKMNSQHLGRKDEWFLHNEYRFYKELYPLYNNAFCNFTPLIACDYMKSTEHDRHTNIILTEDLTDKALFPFWFEELNITQLIFIVRSLAELHVKSMHEMDKYVLSFTDKEYMEWLQVAMNTGHMMFKGAYTNFKTIDERQLQFVSMLNDNIQDILSKELLGLMQQTEFMCLIHGDAVISNILLPNDTVVDEESFGIIPWKYECNDIPRCIFVDWQTYVTGCPFMDLISLFDLLLIDCGSELEHKLFICYLDCLMRFGVNLKGLNRMKMLEDEESMKIYNEMFRYCHLWTFAVESGFWSGNYFYTTNRKSNKAMKVQKYIRKRLDRMINFYSSKSSPVI